MARFPSDPAAPEIVLYALCDDHKRQMEAEDQGETRPPVMEPDLRRKVVRAFRRAGLKAPSSRTTMLAFLRLSSPGDQDGPG